MQTILNNMILIVLNVSLWHGRKKLRSEDLAANGIDVDKLPPGTLATLGSKRIISPAAVNMFSALKREAERLCLQYGVRLIGGYAVPKDRADELNKALAEIKIKFEAARTNLLSVYDEEVEKWIVTNPPEWSPIIRAAVEPVSHLRRAIAFNFAAVTVGAPENVQENGLDEEVNGLYGQLCHEVRVAARQAYEVSYVGKLEVTRKALRPINAIREKLLGMAFLDQSISDIIQVIDDTLDKIPKSGPIAGTDLNMVAGLLGRQLSNMGRVVPEEIEVEEPIIEEENIAETPPTIPASLFDDPPAEINTISWDF